MDVVLRRIEPWLTLVSALTACTAAPDETTTATATATTDGGHDESTGGPEDSGEPDPPVASACPPGTTASAAPRSIAEAVALVNALPHPLSLDCFLERLPRPLAATATISTVSLQPADGARSPRVFLFVDDLVMSIAIDGTEGTRLLEFGELVSPTQSIKGEIEFPVEATLGESDPTARILDETGSQCRLCHGHEAPHPAYETAIVSDALQFRPDELVELEALRAEHEACDASAEPARCARLSALFDHGALVQSPFPYELPTIYDYE